MMSFFSKIFKGSVFTPPENIHISFNERFSDVIDVEWSKTGDNFEAIFYKENIECIAIFGSEGFLLEHKMFLSEGYLPEKIKEILHGKGEIMNVVLINQGNAVRYEIIYRDTELTRYVIVFDITGTILEERVL
jgi:hypothetical protein